MLENSNKELYCVGDVLAFTDANYGHKITDLCDYTDGVQLHIDGSKGYFSYEYCLGSSKFKLLC